MSKHNNSKSTDQWVAVLQYIGLKLLGWVFKLGAFILWCCTSVAELLLREGNKALRNFLFPNKD